MLNPFPIQYLALFAYFILRVFVGIALISLGLKHVRYRTELKEIFKLSWWPYGRFATLTFASAEIVIGALLILGAYTQFAALALIIMSGKMLVMRNWFDHHTIPRKITYVLFLGIGISLFITGAGALAFDLPI